jgi:hypothetical protein
MATFRPLLRIILGKARLPIGYNINGTSSRGTAPVSGPSACNGSQKDLMRDTWSPLIVDDADLQSSLDSNHQKSPVFQRKQDGQAGIFHQEAVSDI